jgi:hypothetical protein
MCASKPCAIFSTESFWRSLLSRNCSSFLRKASSIVFHRGIGRSSLQPTNQLVPDFEGPREHSRARNLYQSKCVRFPSPETRLTPSVHSRSIGELQPRSCRLSGNQEVHSHRADRRRVQDPEIQDSLEHGFPIGPCCEKRLASRNSFGLYYWGWPSCTLTLSGAPFLALFARSGAFR